MKIKTRRKIILNTYIEGPWQKYGYWILKKRSAKLAHKERAMDLDGLHVVGLRARVHKQLRLVCPESSLLVLSPDTRARAHTHTHMYN